MKISIYLIMEAVMAKRVMTKAEREAEEQRIIQEVKDKVVFTTPDIKAIVKMDFEAAEDDLDRRLVSLSSSKNKPGTRAETKEAMKKDSEEAMAKLRELRKLQTGEKRDIEYHSGSISKELTLGEYMSGSNSITIDNNKIRSKMEQEQILQHEQHHKIVDHETITTSDGKVFKPKQAPMSLEQRYKMDQADEIGSKITELLTMRQKYVEAYTNKETMKTTALSELAESASNPDISKLMDAIKSNAKITVKDGKFTFKDGDKEASVALSGSQKTLVSSYVNCQRKFDQVDSTLKNQWVNDEQFGGYFRWVKNGIINPLSTNPVEMSMEMDKIGEICGSMWQQKYGKYYNSQCKSVAAAHFTDSNYQDIKKNDDNFNQAASKALTIGGWDFSGSVKQYLTCPENIKELDKEIASGKNRAAVTDKAVECLGPLCEKNDIESKIVARIVKNSKVTGQAPAPLEPVKDKKVTWTAEDAQNYQQALAEYKTSTFSPKQREELDKQFASLNLGNKKPGEELTKEEVDKIATLRDDIFYIAKEDGSFTDKSKSIGYLGTIKQRYSNIQTEYKKDYGITEKEKAEYKKAYDAVKTPNDPAFEDLNLRDIKQSVAEVSSGIEQKKNYFEGKEGENYAKNLKERRDSKQMETITDEGKTVPLKTAKNMVDFSQPFLKEYYNQLCQNQVKKAEERVMSAIENKKQLAATNPEPSKTPQPQPNKTTTNTNTAVIAAYKANQGR